LISPENGGGVEGAADDDASEQNFRVGLIRGCGFGYFARVANERFTTG
jgi:hypothetical protein